MVDVAELDEESLVFTGNPPWGDLGTQVDNTLSPAQMLKKANLNWGVSREPTFFNWTPKMQRGSKGRILKAEERITQTNVPSGREVLVRDSDGRVLTHITEGWNEMQNVTAAEIFTDFVKAGSMEMVAVGSLMQGLRIWFLARITNKGFALGKKDAVDSYLLFTLPHEYGKTLTVRYVALRRTCWNSFVLSLGNKDDLVIKVSHRKEFDPKIVKEAMVLASNRDSEFEAHAKVLFAAKAPTDKVQEYFKAVWPVSETSRKLAKDPNYISKPARVALAAMENQPGADLGAGTWWQPFNAVTYSMDHLLGMSDDTRLTSSWYGANRIKKIQALQTALEFAKA
jgi:phage/plasmid-like protein (TIGR03299 family)